MDGQPLLLLLGMIAIFSLIFAVTRTLCRDPDLLEAEADMERQQALAEAVVRQMDTHEIMAIASGRFGPGGLLSRGRGRLSHRSQPEQTAGVSQETRMSFIKLSAGRRGYAPSHDVAAAPLPAHVCTTTTSSHPDDEERKSRQATGCSSSNGNGGGDKSLGEGAGRSNLSSRKPSSRPGGAGSSVSSARPRSSKRFLLAAGGAEAPPGEEAVSDGVGGVYSDNSCSVCLDEYEEGDQLLQLTCGHVFHRPCIDHWLKGHRVCPCCRTDLDKLAQVVQLFPQTSKQVLQKALARAEGNLVLAVEILLTRLSSRGTTGSADAAADVDGESTAVPGHQPGIAVPTGQAEAGEAAVGDVCEGERGGEREGRGRRTMFSPALPDGMTPCPAGQHRHQYHQGSPAWRSEIGRREDRSGGGYSSQATTPRASIDPPLPEEMTDDDDREEDATTAAAAAAEDGKPQGSVAAAAAAAAPVVEVGRSGSDVAACSNAAEDVELGLGGFRAGEAGARAGARAASLAAAVAAGAGPADEEEGKSATPVSVSGGMAGAWAARRRSSSFTATGTEPAPAPANGTCIERTTLRAPLFGSCQTGDSSVGVRLLGSESSSTGSQPTTGRDFAARAPPAESATTAAAGSTAAGFPDGSSSPAVLAATPAASARRPSFLSRLASPSPRFSASGPSAYACFESSEGSSSSSSSGGVWEEPSAEGGAGCAPLPHTAEPEVELASFRSSPLSADTVAAGLSLAANGSSEGSVEARVDASGAVRHATPAPVTHAATAGAAAAAAAAAAGTTREAPVLMPDAAETTGSQQAVWFDRGSAV